MRHVESVDDDAEVCRGKQASARGRLVCGYRVKQNDLSLQNVLPWNEVGHARIKGSVARKSQLAAADLAPIYESYRR